jgi:glucan biosynthesis protein C
MQIHPASQRLYFLDWLRIGAFALLVLYHVGMYYVTWTWHVKSPDASSALEPFMRLSSPWRLSLLFLISGAATSFMLLRDGASTHWFGGRSKRLLVPLLFGMAVIVPPQSYFEVVQQHGYAGSYLDFMRVYFTFPSGFCKPVGGCLILPTWNHLWFVAYLFVYTAALWALLRLWPRALDVIAAALSRALRGAAWLWAPIVVLALLRVMLIDRFPPTHALFDDWYLHPVYLGLFVVGAAWARDANAWQRCADLRWPALLLALLAWGAIVGLTLLHGSSAPLPWRWPVRVAFAAMQWSAIVAAVGFARVHLNRDHRWRATLAESVFPVYIAHQTLIILFAMALKPLRWTPAIEGPLLAALTLAASFGVYLAVRRVPALRTVFGLTGAARAPAARPVSARVSAP